MSRQKKQTNKQTKDALKEDPDNNSNQTLNTRTPEEWEVTLKIHLLELTKTKGNKDYLYRRGVKTGETNQGRGKQLQRRENTTKGGSQDLTRHNSVRHYGDLVW